MAEILLIAFLCFCVANVIATLGIRLILGIITTVAPVLVLFAMVGVLLW